MPSRFMKPPLPTHRAADVGLIGMLDMCDAHGTTAVRICAGCNQHGMSLSMLRVCIKMTHFNELNGAVECRAGQLDLRHSWHLYGRLNREPRTCVQVRQDARAICCSAPRQHSVLYVPISCLPADILLYTTMLSVSCPGLATETAEGATASEEKAG